MTRREFSINIAKLILKADELLAPIGYWVVLDYCKRSDEEQARLFAAGKSKCDGYNIRSRHQLGKAADLYVIGEEGMVDPMKNLPNVWSLVRQYWQEQCGGDRMIEWDCTHFE